MNNISHCRIKLFRGISYNEGLELQKQYLAELKGDITAEDIVLFCEHKPVITLGRSGDGSFLLANPQQLAQDGIDYLKVPRGGDVTYHGTGQWTVYPLLRLEKFSKDLHKYMRLIEEGVIRCLSQYNLVAGRREGLTGVWVGIDKICAVGVAVSRWISWHGFAFNVQPDLDLFKKYIIPCGISASEGGVTSLSKLTGRTYDMLDLVEPLLKGLFEVLPYNYSDIELVRS